MSMERGRVSPLFVQELLEGVGIGINLLDEVVRHERFEISIILSSIVRVMFPVT